MAKSPRFRDRYEPAPRDGHKTILVGDKLYMWGGNVDGMPLQDSLEKKEFLSQLDVFHVESGEWVIQVTSGTPPLGVDGYACAAVGNILLYFGGMCANGLDSYYQNSIHELSTLSLQWVMLSPSTSADGTPMKKAYCEMVAYKDGDEDVLFVIGGLGPTPSSHQPRAEYEKAYDNHFRCSEHHMFTLSTREWSSPNVTGQSPPPCDGRTITMVDKKRAALFGGLSGSQHHSDLFVAELSRHTVHWNRIGNSVISCSVKWPMRRHAHAATCISGPLLVIVGGWVTGEMTCDCWIYDFTTMHWKQVILPESVTKRMYHSLSAIQVSPHCVWLVVFGGLRSIGVVPISCTVIIELMQGEKGQWWVSRVVEGEALAREYQHQLYQRFIYQIKEKEQLEEQLTTENHQLIRENQQLVKNNELLMEEKKQLIKDKEWLQQQVLMEAQQEMSSERHVAEHYSSDGGGKDPSSLQLTTADVIYAYDVSLRASKEKEQQLQSQLATVQQESQDKEKQLLKLEDDMYDMQKRMLVLRDDYEQQQEELKMTHQRDCEANLTAHKKEQHQLLQVLEQTQKMARGRDVQISMLQYENELLQDKLSSQLWRMSTVDTAVQADYLAVAPGFLRGVEVYEETVLLVVGDKPQKLEWPGYGFYLEVPEGALAPGVTASVGVKVILAGQFKIPENRQLISAIYWISSSEVFLKDLAVNIQHFAVITSEEQCSNFRFIIAKCSQKELPYTFKEREGSFNPHTQYATIKLKHFSLLGETGPESTKLRFTCLKFYKPIPNTLQVDFIFVVICNHEIFVEVIRRRYQNYFEDEQFQMLVFENDVVTLDLPATPPKVVDSWKIHPLTYPQIAKVDAQQFKQGKTLPACTIELEWVGAGEPKPLSHQVNIIGAKKPENYFHMRYYPQAQDKASDGTLFVKNVTPLSTADTTVTKQDLSKPPELRDFLNQVASNAKDKWRMVGLALDIKQHQLNTISDKFQNPILCYSEVFTAWENREDPALFTWATIVKALESPIVEEKKLAKIVVDWLAR